MKNQKGFSLVELLVVVIIIAIIAAIAIPSLLASRRAANEASAVNSLRTIASAEAAYAALNSPAVAYGTLVQMAGQNLIDDALGASETPSKSGYTFNHTLVATTFTGFCTTATPTTAYSTGTRVFAVSSDNVIYGSTNANPTANVPSCSAGALTVNGALAIQ